MKTVLIGIQARSTSTRLPNKVNMRIEGRSILERVVGSCCVAADYVDRETDKGIIKARAVVAILVPSGDPILNIAGQYHRRTPILEGDEHDVLSRYVRAQREFGADFIVRVTSDCLFLPPHHIMKHVKAALLKDRDYTTNVHFRTHKEGWDCEVMTARLLDWLNDNAKEAHDREHVTTLIGPGKKFPFTFDDGKPSICHILNLYDESNIKTSIDTKEEFDAAVKLFQNYMAMRGEAQRNGICMT